VTPPRAAIAPIKAYVPGVTQTESGGQEENNGWDGFHLFTRKKKRKHIIHDGYKI